MRLFPRQLDSGLPAYGLGRSRRGMTLVELLIVVTILTTLVAAVIPILTPSTNQRRIREAARGLNTFIYSQQSTAISGRKLVGIGLKRLSLDTGRPEDRGVCLEVFAVEQPEPYCGFDANSAARVAVNPGYNPNSPNIRLASPLYVDLVTRGQNNSAAGGLPFGWIPDLIPAGVIRVGDTIEISGNRYLILGVVSDQPAVNSGMLQANNGDTLTRLGVRAINTTGQAVVPYHDERGNRLNPAGLAAGEFPPYWSQPAPYKIHRQPVATSARPYQLPEGTAIDLQGSGMMDDVPLYLDSAVRQNLPSEVLNRVGLRDNNDPIFIMFTPEGTVGGVYYNGGGVGGDAVFGVARPTSNLSLLVGRRELIPASTTVNLANPVDAELEAAKAQVNWLNLESAWVTIGTQTGSIITTEMNNIQPARLRELRSGSLHPLEIRRLELLDAREFARESSRAGGN